MAISPDGGTRPAAKVLPTHLAVVMDGNGRWAERRRLPRAAGHRAGVKAARLITDLCGQRGIEHLTLFAFSSEKWRRPSGEVGLLMQLFVEALQQQVDDLAAQGVRLRFIGALDELDPRVREMARDAEARTAGNTGLTLTIAMAYGGRWDLVEAARALALEVRSGDLDPAAIDEERLAARTCMAGVPAPDLLLRTGGEHRISNFLLWDLAYAELYFTDALWPDFDEAALDAALDWFAGRERRFGQTSDQITGDSGA
jgi:undecaprenyl diphosphate synthase